MEPSWMSLLPLKSQRNWLSREGMFENSDSLALAAIGPTLPASEPGILCAFCPSAFSLASQQARSHWRWANVLTDSPADVWEMEDGPRQPAHTCCCLAHSTQACAHRLTGCPFLGCLGAPSSPHFYIFVPADQFSLSPHCWLLSFTNYCLAIS